MTEFEFLEELPRRTNKSSSDYVAPERQKLADACKANPGKWVKVPLNYYEHLSALRHFTGQVNYATSPAFRPKGAFTAKVREGIVYMMYKGTMKCPHCHRDLTECRMDNRGLCIRDPKSDGITVKRTKKEKKRDRRARNVD